MLPTMNLNVGVIPIHRHGGAGNGTGLGSPSMGAAAAAAAVVNGHTVIGQQQAPAGAAALLMPLNKKVIDELSYILNGYIVCVYSDEIEVGLINCIREATQHFQLAVVIQPPHTFSDL